MRDFVQHPRWLVKDPRICRLLPLWSGVQADPRGEVRFLHIVRQPLAVAASLAARNGLSTARSLLLWLRHILEAEKATRSRPRAWLRWEDLTSDPASTLERAFRAAGLEDLFSREVLAGAAQEVLERGAIHRRISGSDELESEFPWVRGVDLAVGHLIEGEDEKAEQLLDEIDRTMAASERQLLLTTAPSTTSEDAAMESGAELERPGALQRLLESLGKRQSRQLDQLEEAVGGLGRKIKERINRDEIVRHPTGEPDMNFLYGTIFVRQGGERGHSRNACVFADGELDRSPTGTGVSGRAAIEFQRGNLDPGEILKIESFIGTRFEVSYREAVEVAGIRAIIPEVRGSAHICGEHRFVLDPRDGLVDGFLVR